MPPSAFTLLAAGLAFLAALLVPVNRALGGDVVGPFGLLPPAATELLGVLAVVVATRERLLAPLLPAVVADVVVDAVGATAVLVFAVVVGLALGATTRPSR